MTIRVEIEVEIIITSKDNREPNYTDKLILKSIEKITGTKTAKMYIDDFKLIKTEVIE